MDAIADLNAPHCGPHGGGEGAASDCGSCCSSGAALIDDDDDARSSPPGPVDRMAAAPGAPLAPALESLVALSLGRHCALSVSSSGPRPFGPCAAWGGGQGHAAPPAAAAGRAAAKRAAPGDAAPAQARRKRPPPVGVAGGGCGGGGAAPASIHWQLLVEGPDEAPPSTTRARRCLNQLHGCAAPASPPPTPRSQRAAVAGFLDHLESSGAGSCARTSRAAAVTATAAPPPLLPPPAFVLLGCGWRG